jgi:hypothetical protein
MAYITTANSKKIIKKIDFNAVEFSGEVYLKPIYFFNKYEEQSLLAIQEMLENPTDFFIKYYDFLKKEVIKKFVFDNANPAFHEHFECPNLHADFRNYLIPKEILDRGQEEAEKYSAWFKEVMYLLEDDDEIKLEIFKERCRLRFNLALPPEIYKKNNSGSFEIENMNLDELEDTIDKLIKAAGRFYYRSEKNKDILKYLSKYAYLGKKPEPIYYNNTGYPEKEVKEVLSEFESEFKIPLMHLIQEWYRMKLNPNLKFEGELLEKLGFKPCGCCHNPDFSPIQDAEVVEEIRNLPF